MCIRDSHRTVCYTTLAWLRCTIREPGFAGILEPEFSKRCQGWYPDVYKRQEQMYVATTPDKIHGAGVLAYQDFMDQAAERAGGDFFILPSSIHEILIVPDDGNATLSQLQDMVREVNATQVAPEEKLTDNVYHYDSKDKIFELGEKFVERQAAKEAEMDDKSEKGSVLDDLKAKKDEVAKQPKKEAVDKATKSKGEEL